MNWRIIPALFLFGVGARAQSTSPFGFSLLAVSEHVYLEFPGPQDDVCGLRLTLIRSLNKNVCGIDLGVIWNVTTGNFTGFEFAAIENLVLGRAKIMGLQWGGIQNVDREATIGGIQLAAYKNRIAEDGTVIGLQFALFWNSAPKTDVYGMQLALLNRARKVYGFQFGLMNLTEELHGIQLGVFNMNEKGPLTFFPIINAAL